MGITNPVAAFTPGRRTRTLFDLQETVVIEDAWGGARGAMEICAIGSRDALGDSQFCNSVTRWSTGAITLRPYQEDLALIQNTGYSGPDWVYVPTSTGTPAKSLPLFTTSNVRRYSTTTGTSDYFFRSQRPASSPVGSGAVTAPTDQADFATGIGAVGPAVDPIIPFARSVGPANERADQGWCLRWSSIGMPFRHYDVVLGFTFGQYGLELRGSGIARLWERGKTSAEAAYTWRCVASFRYAKPSQVSGHDHILLIFPLVGPNGEQLLHFRGNHLDSSETLGAGMIASPGQVAGGGTTLTERVYRRDVMTVGTLDESPGHATKAAPFCLWMRLDHRVGMQLSRLVFTPTGFIADHPWNVGGGPAPVTYSGQDSTPTGTTLTATTRDAQTGLTTGIKRPYVRWEFTSDGNDTPVLWDYRLSRGQQTETITPGQFTATPARVSMSIGTPDPRSEQGRVTIDDVSNACPRLKKRGELSWAIEVQWTPPGGSPIWTRLLRGVAIRPIRTKVGNNRNEGFAQQGPGHSPAQQDLSRFEVTGGGQWLRLARVSTRTALTWREFSHDPAVARDSQRGFSPWKVTAVLREVLLRAGFPSGQIDLPDLPIRLWKGVGVASSDLIVDNTTNLAEAAIGLARNYLGAWLWFDCNAGSEGKWRLILPPVPGVTPTPVMHFTTSGPTLGKVFTMSAYDFIGDAPVVPTLDRLDSYTDPPEGNHVWVITAPDLFKTGGGGIGFGAHFYNPKSYNAPGFDVVPNADSAHYLGLESLILVADPTLWSGDGPRAHEHTQGIVNFTCRRVGDRAAYPYKIQPLRAPLAFVYDTATSKWRPPRFLDPVTFNGQTGWYIRSCSPSYQSDRMQVANYELERRIPLSED